MALSAGRGRRARVRDGRQQQRCGQSTQHWHKQVHVHRQVQQTVVEAKRDALRVQVRGGVVAQVLRVAEDKAGAMEVVRVPGRERQDGGKQRAEPSGVRAAQARNAAFAHQQKRLQNRQRDRRDDCSLF